MIASRESQFFPWFDVRSYLSDREPVSNATSFVREIMPAIETSVLSYVHGTQWAFNRLDKFSKLSDDWDGYGALAPTANTLANARRLASQLPRHGYQIQNVAIGPQGDINITTKFDRSDKSFIFMLYDHEYKFLVKRGTEYTSMIQSQGGIDFKVLEHYR